MASQRPTTRHRALSSSQSRASLPRPRPGGSRGSSWDCACAGASASLAPEGHREPPPSQPPAQDGASAPSPHPAWGLGDSGTARPRHPGPPSQEGTTGSSAQSLGRENPPETEEASVARASWKALEHPPQDLEPRSSEQTGGPRQALSRHPPHGGTQEPAPSTSAPTP